MANIHDFVDVYENLSSYPVEDMVHVCKRKNNKKRDFVFVNSYQGKHVPVSPKKVIKLFEELSNNVKKFLKDEKVFVIAFAETATAIGGYIAQNFDGGYAHTTREIKPNEKPLLEFKEEHSHSVEQCLYADLDQMMACDTILFVDDEITTGKTVLNLIKELEELGLKKKYAIASFLNWQEEPFENIDTYYLVKGKIKDLNAKVVVSEEIATEFSENENTENTVLFLGTEEYMLESLLHAVCVDGGCKSQNAIFHATTRSPIEVSNENDYPLNKRNTLRSPYDKDRVTYLYNLKKYDEVYIFINMENVINEQDVEAFKEDIYYIFKDLECDKIHFLLLSKEGEYLWNS